jgi:hypothetical protein
MPGQLAVYLDMGVVCMKGSVVTIFFLHARVMSIEVSLIPLDLQN